MVEKKAINFNLDKLVIKLIGLKDMIHEVL